MANVNVTADLITWAARVGGGATVFIEATQDNVGVAINAPATSGRRLYGMRIDASGVNTASQVYVKIYDTTAPTVSDVPHLVIRVKGGDIFEFNLEGGLDVETFMKGVRATKGAPQSDNDPPIDSGSSATTFPLGIVYTE